MLQQPKFLNNLSLVIIWAISLLGITALCAIAMAGINLDEDFSPLLILIAYLPSLLALCALAIFYGKTTLKTLGSQLLTWRLAPKWYVLAAAGPVVLVLIANLLYMLTGSEPEWSAYFDIGALAAGTGALIAGSLGEEIGWRGFAQPLLQKQYTALIAAVVVGILWSLWHLWPVMIPDSSTNIALVDVAQTFMRLIATSIIYAWLYNSTGGSLLLVMIAHAGHNIAINLMPANDTLGIIIAGLYVIAASVIVRITGVRLSSHS